MIKLSHKGFPAHGAYLRGLNSMGENLSSEYYQGMTRALRIDHIRGKNKRRAQGRFNTAVFSILPFPATLPNDNFAAIMPSFGCCIVREKIRTDRAEKKMVYPGNLLLSVN
jgi:hypothetical protein